MPDYIGTISVRSEKSEDRTWHGKEMEFEFGRFQGDVDLMEQAQKAGMLYKVEVVPVNVTLPDGKIHNEKGQYLLMRPPTSWEDGWYKFKPVSDRYTPIQNVDLIKGLKPLLAEWPVESMGTAKHGQIVWFELALPKFDVGGHSNETLLRYFMSGNNHKDGAAFSGMTNTRIVCNNTFASSISGKEITKIPHNADVQMELLFNSALVAHVFKTMKQQEEILNRMFTTPMKNLNDVVANVFPYPQKGRAMRMVEQIPDGAEHVVFDTVKEKAEKDLNIFEGAKRLADKRRQAVADAFVQFNDEQPYAGDTVYSFFNAGTQVLNHDNSFTGSPSKNQVSLLFGQKRGMTDVLWKECVELLK